MLPKFYKLIDSECEVKFNKYVCGKDESQLGAFRCGEMIEFRITVSRRLGAMGVVLRIARDGCADVDMPFEKTGGDEIYDVYALRIITGTATEFPH